MSIVVGEIGWPSDGDENANLQNAQRFSQGFMSRCSAGTGTPLRPGQMDAYLFSLIDEDAKSIQPGNIEHHWGLFYYDGQPKYNLNLGTTNSITNLLVAAKGIQYMAQQWCVISPSESLIDPQVAPSVSYACANAYYTSLGYMTSCGNLTDSQNISYAFNDYYQQNNQLDSACKFHDLSIIATQNPSTSCCNFTIRISTYYSSALSSDATDNYCCPRRAISLAALLSYFLDMIFYHRCFTRYRCYNSFYIRYCRNLM